MSFSSPIAFELAGLWQQKRQNVVPSGILTGPFATGTSLSNHQAVNPCCVAITRLIKYLITLYD